ncbi:VOC family protein [Hypericibacter sp.]|uniref:VOC family protein n=1 Tax=Hypericibacter sp. TaxID=2705401 RepID=UPI003D6C82F5
MEDIMYDHVGLKVKDVEASARFYKAALTPLGYGLVSQDASGAGFGPPDAPALWLQRADSGKSGGTHVALSAADHAAVDRFYKEGMKAGGRDNGKPGPRPDYSPTYYAAFMIDPDGNNIEAVCLK